MIRSAIEVMHNSYSPYSKFKVGAAALLKDGTIITGTNVENASYGLSMCAERVCLYTIYAKGIDKYNVETDTASFTPLITEQITKEAYDNNLEDYKLDAEFKRSGKTKIIFENPDGTKDIYKIDIRSDRYFIEKTQ